MKKRTKSFHGDPTRRLGILALAAISILLAGPRVQAGDRDNVSLITGRLMVGSWYLALDAGSFDPMLAGRILYGVAHFHPDGTFMISDFGDFGAQSFIPTFATPQYGAWNPGHRGDGSIEGTSVYLEADNQTGEAVGWNKVHFAFRVVDPHNVEATFNAFFLPCEDSLPIPTPLSCPDPIANAAGFLPVSPPDVPFTLTRIVVGE